MEYAITIYTVAVQAFQFLILGYFIGAFFEKRNIGKINGIHLFAIVLTVARFFYAQILMSVITERYFTPYLMVIMAIALYSCYEIKLWQVPGVILAYIGICVIPTVLVEICARWIPYMPHDILHNRGSSPETVIVISLMDMIVNLIYVAILVSYYARKKSLHLLGKLLFVLVFLYQMFVLVIYLEKCMIYHPLLIVTGMCMAILTSLMDIMLIAGIEMLLEQAKMEARINFLYEQRACQQEYHQNLEEQRTEFAALEQDFSQKLERLYREVDEQENAGALKELMDDTFRKLEHYRVKQYCRNQVINSVIFIKKKQADMSGIAMDVSVNLPEKIDIEILDLCSIFCNLLDNALEACQKVHGNCQPYISLSAGIHAGYLFIAQANSMEGQLRRENGRILTGKANPDLHGKGLELITLLCEKYDGRVEIKEQKEKFSILVTVKIK